MSENLENIPEEIADNSEAFEIEPIVVTDAEQEEKSMIVGVGASAGGLEALEKFFANIDPDTRLAFVVVQHLSPDYKSLMVELLSKHTTIPVQRVEDGKKVLPNNIYLIPPKKNMTIFHNKLYLTDQNHSLGLNLPIDIFFRSLAEDQGENSIGVILSGTGSDGTLGIRAIKGAGGIVMVQDEQSAKFDGMPKSAMNTGLVDFIASPEKMGELLKNYLKHPYVKKKDITEVQNIEDTDSFTKILAIIRTQTGVDFTYYKPNTIIRRIERRMSVNQFSSLDSYAELITQSPAEAITLYKELLIGVTRFFRDTDAFSAFTKKVIPEMFKSKRKQIRIWTSGCSTGEEAYSVAILLRDYMEKNKIMSDIKIFATDIDKDAIEYASNGVYPESVVADIPEEFMRSYFTKQANTFKINESIRQMVIFARHNIIKDPPFSKIDLIICRNLLIYFQPVMQKKVLSAFSFSLNPGGFLFLGSSETIGELSSIYAVYDSKWKIYKSTHNSKIGLISDLYVPTLRKDKLTSTGIHRSTFTEKSNDDMVTLIQKSLFEEFVPPSIIINNKFDIVHVYKDVNNFLKLPTGKMNFNLMNMINKDLSLAISTAVHRIQKEKKEIVYKDINFETPDGIKTIKLKIKPYVLEQNFNDLVLIAFEEYESVKQDEEHYEDFNMSDKEQQRISDLENELKHIKENLQATIEELETSNEELQATNEELIASNEELQSTNEELQSVNEELYTVNSEYQNKIEELTELNNDINNWFNSTHIGTIFLDLKLRIRKFTASLKRFVNIIENDNGRPFMHISYNFKYEDFMKDIENVIDDLTPIEKEVQANDGSWLQIRILPYRTVENAVKGIVLTIVDISKLKNAQMQIKNEKDLLISILEDCPNGKILVDKLGVITFVNKKAQELLRQDKSRLVGKHFDYNEWSLYDDDDNLITSLNHPFTQIIDTGKAVKSTPFVMKFAQGTSEKILLIGTPIFDENNNVNGAVIQLEEVKSQNDE